MRVTGKVVVVTGGASGIGAALCERFAAAGASHVAVLDLNLGGAQALATAIGGSAAQVDVTREEQLVAAIDAVEARHGQVDLFCSNAGVLANDTTPGDPASAPEEQWETSWRVHVMSHVYAARRLAPRMAARGSGYFLSTISAAGLLTQLGSGPYSTSKHGAVGFAESLAVAYYSRGVRVSILCPQGVDTPMVRLARDTPAVLDGLLMPHDVADAALEGIAQERFLILPHPQVATYMSRKAADYDRWIKGMARLAEAAPHG